MSLETQEVQNRTCDICASENFFVEILILFVQRMFRNGKKKYFFGNSLRIGVGQQKIVLFSFFPMLIAVAHACLSREGDVFVIVFEVEKRSRCCFDKSGPMSQTLSV